MTSSGPAPVRYAYDLDKQLVEAVDAGRAVTFERDAAGRLEQVLFLEGEVVMSYHPTTGKLTTVAGPYGVNVAFTHDGALLTRTTFSGAVSGHVAWSYDTAFRLATESLHTGAASTVAFGYDADDLLTSAGPLSLTRDTESGRVVTSTAGLVTDDVAYSPYGEVEARLVAAGSADLLALAYERDALGRITQVTETRGAAAPRVTTYAYDLAGRLAAVREGGQLVEAYTFDPNGNRIEVEAGAASSTGPGLTEATFDEQDRLLQQGSVTYAYAPTGELEERFDAETGELTTATYDARGNLVEVVLPDATSITYRADGQGRRVEKSVDGAVERRWLWRSQLQPAAELDAAGNVTQRYVYAGGVNSPELVVVTGGPTYRLVKDHLGSVRLVVDVATGAIAQELVYDAWGRVLLDTNPGLQPFGYAGGLYDPDTGWVRFGARDYDPEVGRWLSKDPIRFGGGLNLYGYVGGEPVNWRDVTGRHPDDGSEGAGPTTPGDHAAAWAQWEVAVGSAFALVFDAWLRTALPSLSSEGCAPPQEPCVPGSAAQTAVCDSKLSGCTSRTHSSCCHEQHANCIACESYDFTAAGCP